jgi:NADP-dependent 3-hydroxy acid dehydrogenase YdfG
LKGKRNEDTSGSCESSHRVCLAGPVDGLINNAGVMLLGNAHEQNPQEWKTMFDVNVMGLINGIHVVLAKMKARKSGTVINISSIAGHKTFPSHAAYCGTKFAVHASLHNMM